MVEMICGIGGITALGDWIQLTLKPEQIVKQKTGIKEAISGIVGGSDDEGFLESLQHDTQEETRQQLFPDKIRIPVAEYMRDNWNVSTRVRVKVDIIKTWQPKQDAPPGHKFEWDEREID